MTSYRYPNTFSREMTLRDQGSFRLVFSSLVQVQGEMPSPAIPDAKARRHLYVEQRGTIRGRSLDAQRCSAQGSLPASIPSDDVSEKRNCSSVPFFRFFHVRFKLPFLLLEQNFLQQYLTGDFMEFLDQDFQSKKPTEIV